MGKTTKPKKEKPTPTPEINENSEEEAPNFMELLNSPMAQSVLGGCKDLLKPETTDPNICEITIKAPSEVVLKLFNVPGEK